MIIFTLYLWSADDLKFDCTEFSNGTLHYSYIKTISNFKIIQDFIKLHFYKINKQ